MCESGFLEGCSADFTNYCHVSSLCDENIGRHCATPNYRRVKSSKVKSRVAWFTKKSNVASRHSINASSRMRIRSMGERLGQFNASLDIPSRPTSHLGSTSSTSDEEFLHSKEDLKRTCVSKEELEALKGCVTQRRALFSPNQLEPPSSFFSNHTIPKEKSDLSVREPYLFMQTVPKKNSAVQSQVEDKILTTNSDQYRFQPNQESLVFEPLESCFRSSVVPDSVSVQFKAKSYDCVMVCQTENLGVDDDTSHHFATLKGESSLLADDGQCVDEGRSYSLSSKSAVGKFNSGIHCSSSIPGRLNSPNLQLPLSSRSQFGQCRHSRENICKCQKLLSSPVFNVKNLYRYTGLQPSPSSQATCNSWPRSRIFPETEVKLKYKDNQDTTHDENINSVKKLHQSYDNQSPIQPYTYSSECTDAIPLSRYGLAGGHSFGSTNSMHSLQSHSSSVTNFSSCADRPHFSNGKGVEGMEFKDKSEVSQEDLLYTVLT